MVIDQYDIGISDGRNPRSGDEDREDEIDADPDGKKKRTPPPHPYVPFPLISEGRKIEIAFMKDKSRRHITFSKRKAGILKKVKVFPAI